MVSGTSGAFHLGATSTARIEYVATSQHHTRRRVEVEVEVEVVSPTGGTARAELRTFGGRVVRRWSLPVKLPAGSSKRLALWRLADIAPEPGAVFLHASFNGAETTHFFAPPKCCPLEKPGSRKSFAAALSLQSLRETYL